MKNKNPNNNPEGNATPATADQEEMIVENTEHLLPCGNLLGIQIIELRTPFNRHGSNKVDNSTKPKEAKQR